MKYYFIKSPLLLVISLIVPSCRIPAIQDTRGPSPAAGTTIAGSKTADQNAVRSDKGRAISVDGIVELY
ncbi:MAG TPA: hypothetical protein VF939_01565 [Puia sp.]